MSGAARDSIPCTDSVARLVSRARPIARGLRRRLLVGLLFVALGGSQALIAWQAASSPANQVGSLRKRAAACIRLGRSAAAVAALRTAESIDPSSAAIESDLAEALVRAGDRDAARAALERACALDPDAAPARLNLAWLSIQAGDVARARALEAWLADPKRATQVRDLLGPIALLTARLARLSVEPARAAEAAALAVSLRPHDERALTALAEVALASGDPATARAALEPEVARAGAGAPWRLRILLARALAGEGHVVAAGAALDAVGGEPVAVAVAAMSRGQILLEAHQIEGLDVFVEAVERAPEGTPLASLPALARRYLAGLHELAHDRPADALPHLRAACEADPASVAAGLALGRALAATGERTAARAELRRVLALDPLSRAARLDLARAALLDGDADEARLEATVILRAWPGDAAAPLILAASRERRTFSVVVPEGPTLTPLTDAAADLPTLDLRAPSAISRTAAAISTEPPAGAPVPASYHPK